MDAHHTFKGDRKKANRGVFKLLRLKSSRKLRFYRRKPPLRVQKCSRCHKIGHNSKNKLCLARQEGDTVAEDDPVGDGDRVGELVGDGDQSGDDVSGVGQEATASADSDILGHVDPADSSDLVDIEDLLDSDDDLF